MRIIQLALSYSAKMTSSITVAFTGTSSVLQANFLPEIILDGEYSCALLDLIIRDTTDKILKFGEMYIKCNIISDSYINGEQNGIIHQFNTIASIAKSQTLVEIPRNLNYFPIKVKSLQSIHISIVNSKGELLDINSDIICRINIKRN